MASISRSGSNRGISCRGCLWAISAAPSCSTCRLMQLILSRLPATLELTLAAVIGRHDHRRAARHVCGLQARQRASKVIMAASVIGFLVPTFWIGLVLIFHLRGAARLAACRQQGRDGDALRRRVGASSPGRADASLPARAQPVALQVRDDGAPLPRRHARDDADGHRALRPGRRRERMDDPAQACAAPDLDPARHGLRPRIRLHPRLRRGDGDDLLLARHRQADHRLDHLARPAG